MPYYTTNQHSYLGTAPGDLLIEIANSLHSRVDILNLSLTANHLFYHISSVLYKSLILNSVEQCTITLSMLQKRPDIASHVRELIVCPRTRRKPRHNMQANSDAAAAVRDLAASHRLETLTKFVWDADEMPLHEDMWFALRKGCPQLRHIATTVGRHLPSSNSHLFDFTDLHGFSLTLTPGFYEQYVDMFFEENLLSRRMWNMLIYSCPNLEELSIEGVSSLPPDAHNVARGRWPRLRKLILGDVSVDSLPDRSDDRRPFVAFLESHPNLETVCLSRHTVQPMHLGALDPTALTNLSSFSGTLHQLQALSHLHPSLTSVTFRDPMQTRELSALTVAGLLQGLTSLSELRISFLLNSMYDSGTLLRSLVTSCPGLRHLELVCGQKPSFQLDSFSRTLRGFPKLRSLHLTIVRYPGDESISSGARRIAKANPRLANFTLTFIPPSYISAALCPPSPTAPSAFTDHYLLNQSTVTLPIHHHHHNHTLTAAPYMSTISILSPLASLLSFLASLPFLLTISLPFMPNISLPTSIPSFLFPLYTSTTSIYPTSFFSSTTTTTGVYTLACDKHGLPLSLNAKERAVVVWPWWPFDWGASGRTGSGGKGSVYVHSRRYVSDLRGRRAFGFGRANAASLPLSSQAGADGGTVGESGIGVVMAMGNVGTWTWIGGWKGIVGMLSERSAAGEEMRMLVFCTALVGLAVWGFWGGGRPGRVATGSVDVIA